MGSPAWVSWIYYISVTTYVILNADPTSSKTSDRLWRTITTIAIIYLIGTSLKVF